MALDDAAMMEEGDSNAEPMVEDVSGPGDVEIPGEALFVVLGALNSLGVAGTQATLRLPLPGRLYTSFFAGNAAARMSGLQHFPVAWCRSGWAACGGHHRSVSLRCKARGQSDGWDIHGACPAGSRSVL